MKDSFFFTCLHDNTMEDEGRQKKVEAGRVKVIILRFLYDIRIDYAHLILPCWYDRTDYLCGILLCIFSLSRLFLCFPLRRKVDFYGACVKHIVFDYSK